MAIPHQIRRRIALICDSLEDDFQSALVDAGLSAAVAHDVDLIVVPGGKLGETAGKTFIHDLAPSWADGIILAAHTIGHVATEQEMRQLLERLRPVPVVALGEVEGADCCLAIDNEGAAYELTQHLVLQHHHERFAQLSGPAGNIEARARADGFSRALRESGPTLPESLRVVGDFTLDGGRRAIAELLDERGIGVQDLDAIVCANDAMAIGACRELERRGFFIPKDVAVVGFDDTELARQLPSPLTTVRQPLRELVFAAMRMLVATSKGERLKRGCYRYGAETIHRRSCGCPRLRNLPPPSTPGIGETSGPESLASMVPAVRDDLEDAFVAGLDQLRPGWLEALLEALFAQLEEQNTTFYDALETLCISMLRARKPTNGWQNTLLVLRRHMARRGLSRPDELPDLDRIIDGALRLTGELTTSYVARQREELLEHLRVLSDATASLLAAPDLNTIADVTRSMFPQLGVERGMISLFASDFRPGVSLVPLCTFGSEVNPDSTPRPATELGPAELLEGRGWVVEPLGTGPCPLGLAVLQAGLAQVSWYERLRNALTAAINGAQLIQQVQRLVITDPLTGLNNRRYLTDRIRQELDPKRGSSLPLSLLVLDLDGFKSLNDEHGHDEGDRALVGAAESIRQCLRETDTLARFGGDEFVAVLPGTTAEQAEAVARRVLQSLPLDLRRQISLRLTCSIGIATTDQQCTGDAELFRLADQALLMAKRSGKNRLVHAREIVAPTAPA